MTKPTGIGRGQRSGSRNALKTMARSPLQRVSLTLRLMPKQAEKLSATSNRSGAIAAFLEAHWQELEAFLDDWQG